MAQSDRALRRMVVTLRAMPEEHFNAVLDTLSGEQRTRVLMLLQEMEGETVESRSLAEVNAPYKPLVVPADLSPWLVARVNGNPFAGDEVADVFSMTDHATRALRDCAAELVPQPSSAPRMPSLISQFVQRIFRKEAVQ